MGRHLLVTSAHYNMRVFKNKPRFFVNKLKTLHTLNFKCTFTFPSLRMWDIENENES